MIYRGVFAAIWIVLFFSYPVWADKEPPKSQGSEVLSDIKISDLLYHASRLEQSKKELDKKDLQKEERDPFFLPGAKRTQNGPPEMGEWRLTAIIFGNRDGVAIINGTILREGDSIRGVLVKKIQKDRVFLVEGERTVELRVSRFTIE